MATPADHFLFNQIIQALFRLVPQMRDNAASYKANPKGLSAAALAVIINQDMVEFQKWFTAFESAVSRNLAAVTSALAAGSVTAAAVNADKNNMKSAASALAAASKTTQAEINTATDAFLAAVPTYERIF